MLFIVMPVYNEQGCIETVIFQWKAIFNDLKIEHYFVIVNDGSTDQTGIILERISAMMPEQMIVLDQPNQGHGRAVRSGYEYAVQNRAEWILQIDSDGQCDPADFFKFWECRHQSISVFGKREKRKDSLVRIILSRCCAVLVLCCTHTWIADANVPFRLIPGPVLARFLACIPKQVCLQNIALSICIRKSTHHTFIDIPVNFESRQTGQSLSFLKLLFLGMDLISDLRVLKKC